MKKIRLEFDFTEEAYEKLQEIIQRTNASNRAEVVRKALLLYDHITHNFLYRIFPISIVIGKNNGDLKVL